jgi:hypothetical protein
VRRSDKWHLLSCVTTAQDVALQWVIVGSGCTSPPFLSKWTIFMLTAWASCKNYGELVMAVTMNITWNN